MRSDLVVEPKWAQLTLLRASRVSIYFSDLKLPVEISSQVSWWKILFIFAKHHQESQNKMHLVTLGSQGDKAVLFLFHTQ